jgi:hypothetical protein
LLSAVVPRTRNGVVPQMRSPKLSGSRAASTEFAHIVVV